MIFKLSQGSLCETKTDYTFNDLQFEKLVIGQDGIHELNYGVFNEALLYLGRQVSNNNSYITFYALDTFGRGVLIELKKSEGKQGIGTQCLTSINLTATRSGDDFVQFCLGRKATEEEAGLITEFITCDYTDINKDSRVVFMAQSFDPSVYNFGNWITENNFAFKAIRYFSTKFNGESLFDFSTEFETFSKYSYSLKDIKNLKKAGNENRKPAVYFHDIGHADERWWSFLQKTNIITSSYDNFESSACRGYVILNQYIAGDTVIAFAKNVGVVGVGTVTSKGYSFKQHDMNDFANSHYHTRSVQWDTTLNFNQAFTAKYIEEKGLNWPVQSKQEIRYHKGVIESLINEMRSCLVRKKIA